MSFFGFDATLPRDHGHSANAPGFGHHDAFASLGGGAADDDAYVYRARTRGAMLMMCQGSISRRRTMA
jgi:hypothetical protein